MQSHSLSHTPRNYFNDISILEAWRLFIDGRKQKKENGWRGFEIREPGYLSSICKCMAYALSRMNDEIDVNFIQELHKLALENVANTNYDLIPEKPGQIRSHKSSYGLSKSILTKEGLKEIMNKNQDFIELTFSNPSPELTLMAKAFLPFATATEEQKELFASSAYQYVQNDNVKIEGYGDSKYDQHRDTFIKNQLMIFIEEYKYAMKNAKGDLPNQISIILKFVKNCEHMHVFADGNGRVFYMVLLYLLFAKYNIPLPLMENVNQIAGYSLDELLVKINEGWTNKNSLLMNESLFNISTIDILANLNNKEKKYFLASLKPLIPYFKPSVILDFADVYVAKNNIAVNAMINKNLSLLKVAYKFFMNLVYCDKMKSIIKFEKYFPALFLTFIHYKDQHHATPLLWAAFNECYSITYYLLQKGADPSIKDRWGYDAINNLKQGIIEKLKVDDYSAVISFLNKPCDELVNALSLPHDWRNEVITNYFHEQRLKNNTEKLIKMKKAFPELFKDFELNKKSLSHSGLFSKLSSKFPFMSSSEKSTYFSTQTGLSHGPVTS